MKSPLPYRVLVGMEVHLQLSSSTKLFCGCPNRFGEPPNTLVCPVCLGLPGSLPVLNERALTLAMRAALALDCQIAEFTKWDRKNYFYPDLPKAYQITQYDMPLSTAGAIEIDGDDGRPKTVGIIRAHLEEDTGTSRHSEDGATLVDYNRAGVPLLEVVGAPDLASAKEAVRYLLALKETMEYAGVSDCDMEKGNLRAEPNVNLLVRTGSEEIPTPIAELKNLNSLVSVERAILYEIDRQWEEWNRNGVRGGPGMKSTRGFDEIHGVTVLQREKEEAEDYRYFPEPDLPPVTPKREVVEALRRELPEPPRRRRERLVTALGISSDQAAVLTGEKPLADFFEEVVAAAGTDNAAAAANFVQLDVLRERKERHLTGAAFPVEPGPVGEIVRLVSDGVITRDSARHVVWPEVLKTGRRPTEIVEEKGLRAVTGGSELEEVVKAALEENPNAVEALKQGKMQAIGPIVGHVMRATRGTADAKRVKEVAMELLAREEG